MKPNASKILSLLVELLADQEGVIVQYDFQPIHTKNFKEK